MEGLQVELGGDAPPPRSLLSWRKFPPFPLSRVRETSHVRVRECCSCACALPRPCRVGVCVSLCVRALAEGRGAARMGGGSTLRVERGDGIVRHCVRATVCVHIAKLGCGVSDEHGNETVCVMSVVTRDACGRSGACRRLFFSYFYPRTRLFGKVH